jgi:hypothetical protein
MKKKLAALFSSLMVLFTAPAGAAEQESQSFVADPNVQKIAEAYALDAVDLANSQFGINLDWSDASIENVEKVLVKMRASYVATTPRPTPEQVMSFAKGFGSYVGEVYRRNHGAEWGMVSLGGQKFPGLRTRTGVNFWPWGRVSNRITDGDENNVLDYYRVLLKK